jgi:hypothetical protein
MITTNDPSAVGVFEDLEIAKRSIDDLRQAGFSDEEIGIIGNVGEETVVPTPREMRQPEGNAILGFVQGSVVGAVIGLLVIAAIPGLAQVSEFGRWFELVGGAALGAVVGGVLLALSSFLFSRQLSRFFAGELERGRYIVTVKNPQRKEEAVSVLRQKANTAIQQKAAS